MHAQRESIGVAGRELARLLVPEPDEQQEAACVLVAELFSLGRHFLTDGKRK